MSESSKTSPPPTTTHTPATTTTTVVTPNTTSTTTVTSNSSTTVVNQGTIDIKSSTSSVTPNNTTTTSVLTSQPSAVISSSGSNNNGTTLVVTPSSPNTTNRSSTSTNHNSNNISVSLTIPNANNTSNNSSSNNNVTPFNTTQEYHQAMENKKTLKKILKSSKHWTDTMKVYCHNSNSFSDELIKHSEQMNQTKDHQLSSSLISFGNTLKAVNIVHDQLFNEVQDVFYTPLNNFVDYDFAEVVESNKRVTKSKEDYEISLGKIQATIKKSKAGIDEQRLFNYEQELEKLKDILESSNKELDYKLQELSHKNETKYLKSLLLFINSQYTFYNRASKLFGNLKPKLEDLERYLEEIQPPKVVEGHLMKKSKQVMGGWNKCWWVLKDGMLFCYKGKKEYHPENALNILLCSVRVPQSIVLSSPSTNMMAASNSGINSTISGGGISGISSSGVSGINSGSANNNQITNNQTSSQNKEKKEDKEKEKDSQYDNLRFEILHPRKKQPIVLQAESEEERDRWVTAIQEAISNSLNCQTLTPIGGLERSVNGIANSSSMILGKAMSNNSSVVQTDEVNQQVLRILQKVPGNNTCADCGCSDPDWAAINLGVLICKVCSGVHRSLGTHISKVRSLTLDKWSPENTLFMKEIGNNKFNLLFEHHLSELVKPMEKSDRMAKELWIKAKYKTKDFMVKSSLPQDELLKILFEMINSGQKDLIRYLKVIAQGADLNQQGEGGRTPLHQSILKSDDVIIPELLLQNTADVTIADSRGWTPMHYAAYFNRPRCAYLLMRRGFESVRNKCRDHLGRLALDLAVTNRSKETEQVLRGDELDSGLTMDAIETNTIPIFAASIPINNDIPIIQSPQEILSDDDDDTIEDENQGNELESLQSWPSENESNGRSSFSGPENFLLSNQNSLENLKTLNSSNSNNSLTSNNNSTGNLNNIIDNTSPLSSSRDNNNNNNIINNNNNGLNTNSNSGSVSSVEIGNRPKSKRRPSILGRGRNTLRAMKNKLNMSQKQLNENDDNEEYEEEDEEEEDELANIHHNSNNNNNNTTDVVQNKSNRSSTNNGTSITNSANENNISDQEAEKGTSTSPNKSPTPFKMFLKKLKIKKGKKLSTGGGGSSGGSGEGKSPQMTSTDVPDNESYIDIPDNISIGTNDDSLISDHESTISASEYASYLASAQQQQQLEKQHQLQQAKQLKKEKEKKEKEDKEKEREKEKEKRKEKKEKEKEDKEKEKELKKKDLNNNTNSNNNSSTTSPLNSSVTPVSSSGSSTTTTTPI